jgi:hypothetical protein
MYSSLGGTDSPFEFFIWPRVPRGASAHALFVRDNRGGARPMPEGVCRYCGCTEARPCLLVPVYFGDPIKVCGWANNSKTLCTNPACLERAKNEKPKPKN